MCEPAHTHAHTHRASALHTGRLAGLRRTTPAGPGATYIDCEPLLPGLKLRHLSVYEAAEGRQRVRLCPGAAGAVRRPQSTKRGPHPPCTCWTRSPWGTTSCQACLQAVSAHSKHACCIRNAAQTAPDCKLRDSEPRLALRGPVCLGHA